MTHFLRGQAMSLLHGRQACGASLIRLRWSVFLSATMYICGVVNKDIIHVSAEHMRPLEALKLPNHHQDAPAFLHGRHQAKENGLDDKAPIAAPAAHDSVVQPHATAMDESVSSEGTNGLHRRSLGPSFVSQDTAVEPKATQSQASALTTLPVNPAQQSGIPTSNMPVAGAGFQEPLTGTQNAMPLSNTRASLGAHSASEESSAAHTAVSGQSASASVPGLQPDLQRMDKLTLPVATSSSSPVSGNPSTASVLGVNSAESIVSASVQPAAIPRTEVPVAAAPDASARAATGAVTAAPQSAVAAVPVAGSPVAATPVAAVPTSVPVAVTPIAAAPLAAASVAAAPAAAMPVAAEPVVARPVAAAPTVATPVAVAAVPVGATTAAVPVAAARVGATTAAAPVAPASEAAAPVAGAPTPTQPGAASSESGTPDMTTETTTGVAIPSGNDTELTSPADVSNPRTITHYITPVKAADVFVADEGFCISACSCWPIWSSSIVILIVYGCATFVAILLSASLFSKGLFSSSFLKGGGYWLLTAASLGIALGCLIGGLVSGCVAGGLGLGAGMMALFTSIPLVGKRGAWLGAMGGLLTGCVIGILTQLGALAIGLGAAMGILLGLVVGFAPVARDIKMNERYIRRGIGGHQSIRSTEAPTKNYSSVYQPGEDMRASFERNASGGIQDRNVPSQRSFSRSIRTRSFLSDDPPTTRLRSHSLTASENGLHSDGK